MSKLVKAQVWIRRHFEPGSEPPADDLREWAMQESKGEIIAGVLYLYDDAITQPPTELDSDTLLA